MHTRLSIIDLDARANQPFERDGLIVVFNGEIYNYREVRAELQQRGVAFRTQSDTEVLLEAYRAWGVDCLDRLEGMWAFALLDTRENRLVLSRDRFGEKPLFYAVAEGTLYFASEVKALAALMARRPQPNLSRLRRFLANGYRSLFKHPDTAFDGVSELPPATVAVISEPRDIAVRRYWTLAFQPEPIDAHVALDGVRQRLERALELRLRADVPLAFCLSGGVDSSALAAIAAKRLGQQIHTFSILDRDERYNETENIAATVADLGCDHHEIRTSPAGFFDRMRSLVRYHDGPVVTISYYIHDFLAQAIHDAGFKVAISGVAADELFTGYYDHYNFWLAAMAGRADGDRLLREWREGYGSHVENPILRDPAVFARTPAERGHLYLNRDVFNALLVEPEQEDFFEESYAAEPLRNRMMNELFHEVVPPILANVDLNTMRWSVENRSPYLDRDLAEFLYTVPSEHLVQHGMAKWLLRAAVDGVVTDQVRLDKRKRGFNASILSLIDLNDPRSRDELLSPGPIFDLVRRETIESFLKRDLVDNSFSKFLFSFVSAKLFLDEAAAAA